MPRLCGRVVFRPWFDAVAVRVVTRGYFPISRGWAAAWAADGDPECFCEGTGRSLPAFVANHVLRSIGRSARVYEAERSAWEDAFFSTHQPATDRLIASERARNRAASRFMRGRSKFLPWFRRLPPVRWSVPTPEEVDARHGNRLARPETAYPAPALPNIETSHAISRKERRTYWMRFPSPILGDTAWAKVIEPEGIAHPPTLVFLHGIGVELEMWPQTADPIDDLVKQGVRIVRPTAPWHAQRMLKGYFGGEPILARGPDGFLTLLQVWVAEAAILLNWARRLGSTVAAIGGVSLGALTSQLVASVGRSWPATMQPDAMFLVTTTGAMLDLLDGSLCRNIGFNTELERAGWNTVDLRRWSPLLEPAQMLAMTPDRVVVVLGKADDLMPYAGGRDLVERWQLPDVNVYAPEQGHFSVPLGMHAERAPIERFLSILRQ